MMGFKAAKIIIFLFFAALFTNCIPEQVHPSPIAPKNDLDTSAGQIDTPTPPPATMIPIPTQIEFDILPVSQIEYRPLIMVYYMPWYQTFSGSGYWGWHWTMNHYDPKQKDEHGNSSIASHYYPQTGPYDSGDNHLLEYQVMLMKISGIDGVIVDWYGFESFWDYGKINASTHKLFIHIDQAGLLFAITYEDRTIQNMLENSYPKVSDAHTHGQEVMQYLQENWFAEGAYLKISQRPVLFLFGNPPYFDSNSDWEILFSDLDVQPFLITQDARVVTLVESGYPWPPRHLSGSQELSTDSLDNYLDNFYARASNWDYQVAGVFPGFHDIYKEAGVGSSYGYLDSNDGETFDLTFNHAFENNPDIIQIITWNDYGEGTNIEPTLEYGFQNLEMIQDKKIELVDGEFSYTLEDLSIPLQIYNLRKQYKGNPEINANLDNAVLAVLAGRIDIAQEILEDYHTQ